jgi:hypothetical protein
VPEGATTPFGGRDIIPEALRVRPISLRAFDAAYEIGTADLAEGDALEPLIVRFLARSDVAYRHAHYARRGCHAALINRA